MKFQIIIYIILIIILGNLNTLANDSLFYRLVEAERKVMSSSSKVEEMHWIIQKSVIYKEKGQFENAISTLNRVVPIRIDTLLYCQYLSALTVNLFLNNDFTDALLELRTKEVACKDTSDEFSLLKLSLLIENKLWDEYKMEVITYCKTRNIDIPANLDSVIRNPEYKDPLYYRKLSARLPGLGMIRAEHKGKGYLNLSLNMGAAAFAVFNFYNGFYVTGTFSGIYPLWRFYSGGKILTERLVEKDNEISVSQNKIACYKILYEIL